MLHLPTVSSLWQTSYGKAILWKVGLLLVAMLLGAVNLLRTKPAPRGEPATARAGAARLLRRLVSVEVVIVASAIFAAAVLSSLPPPPKALAGLGESAAATVGPGRS